MPTVTIFANFRINDEERFLRFKDSFASIKGLGAESWVINVRGKYKWDVMQLLESELGNRLVPYFLESKQGWFYDTRQMLSKINSDFVLFWIEDHICMIDVSHWSEMLRSMKESRSDYMMYSWFSQEMQDTFKGIEMEDHKRISTFLMNESNHKIVQINNPGHFVLGVVGLFSSNLFKRIIRADDPVLRRWPKDYPFDFEKKSQDTHWLPFRQAVPKKELFASIDTDHCYPDEVCSLQARGLYPKRITKAQEEAEKLMIKPSSLAVAYTRIVPKSARDLIARVNYHL